MSADWLSAAAPRRPAPAREAGRRRDSGSCRRGGGGYFEDGGHALTAADAHGLQPESAAAPTELVQQGDHHAGTGGADGVAEGDARAVDVEPVLVVPAPTLQDAEDLAGEGLVEFDEFEVIEAQA